MSLKQLGRDKHLIDFSWREGGRRCRLRRQVFGSPKAARDWEAKLRTAARLGELKPDENKKEQPTFADFSHEWYETYVKANNKLTEQKNKETVLRVHLVPFFGRQLLDETTAKDVERYKAEKVGQGYSPKTVNLHLLVLHKLFQTAIDWEVLERNPVSRVARLKDRKEKWSFLTLEEGEKFLAAVPTAWKPLFLCAIRTGMRQGEILALRWKDVDFKRRAITVDNSLFEGKLYPTKSYGRREIRMTSDLLEALLALRNNGSVYVFPAQDGSPLHRKTLNRPLAAANRGSGVKRIRFHDIRHSFASQMVMAGVPIKTVQEILGHADLKMTLRYAHLTPETRAEAIECLEREIRDHRGEEKSEHQVGENWTLGKDVNRQ